MEVLSGIQSIIHENGGCPNFKGSREGLQHFEKTIKYANTVLMPE